MRRRISTLSAFFSGRFLSPAAGKQSRRRAAAQGAAQQTDAPRLEGHALEAHRPHGEQEQEEHRPRPQAGQQAAAAPLYSQQAAAEAARLIPGGKVAILATDGTISTGLYQKALAEAGVVPFVPQPDVQALVMHEIYDCIKAGRPADRESWAAIDRHLRELGCQKALLACTELSVIRAAEGLPDFYLDPMEIMAVRALEFMGVAQAPLSAPAPSCP